MGKITVVVILIIALLLWYPSHVYEKSHINMERVNIKDTLKFKTGDLVLFKADHPVFYTGSNGFNFAFAYWTYGIQRKLVKHMVS